MADNRKFEQIYTKADRDKIYKKNLKEIRAALKPLDADMLELNKHLIEDCAFYATSIHEINALISRDGLVDFYQNGNDQWGTKKSVAAELKPKYTQTYQNLIKQLTALLPSESEKNAAAELMEFIRRDD